MTDAASIAPPDTVPGRACGSCMQCCKLPAIAELAKPSAKWCVNARPGNGCAIYADRPPVCRKFYCDWMLNPKLGPEWKPDKAKFLIGTAANGAVSVLVDPAAPAAWRAAPYYDALKVFASRLVERGDVLTIHAGRRMTVVLPDRDEEIGPVPDDHVLVVRQRLVDGKLRYEAVVEAKPAS